MKDSIEEVFNFGNNFSAVDSKIVIKNGKVL